MSVSYSIPLTEDHIVRTYAQHRALQTSRLWLMWPIKLLCALGLVGLLGLGIFAKLYAIAVFAIFFLALLAMGPRFDYWSMRRRWRRHPQFNKQMQIVASEDGVTFATPTSSGNFQWPAHTRGVVRPAGVILYTSPADYYWLPDDAITIGTPAEVRELLRAKFPQDAVV